MRIGTVGGVQLKARSVGGGGGEEDGGRRAAVGLWFPGVGVNAGVSQHRPFFRLAFGFLPQPYLTGEQGKVRTRPAFGSIAPCGILGWMNSNAHP